MLAFLFATFGSDLVAHAASIVPAKSMPGDWTTYLYDRNHSGYNSAEKIINPGSAKNLKQHWMIPGTNTISTQPVAANGLVYWGASPDNIIWASPTYYQGSIYIAIASFGDCPLVQGKVFKLNAGTGTIQQTFNLTPNGCTGAGVWGSITIDSSDNSLYFATGNGNVCGQPEIYGEALVKLKTSDLSVISS